jgi:hypothetical protein
VATKTKSKSTSKKASAGQSIPSAAPDTTRFTGQFVKVVSGEHKGLQGAILRATRMDKDGVDDQGVLRTRDDDSQRVVVDYKDLEALDQTQRR